jgi:putative membrane protein
MTPTGDGDDGGYNWGWGAWFVMSVMMLLFRAVVIGGIVVLVRYLTGSRRDGGPDAGAKRSDAEELLAERFARARSTRASTPGRRKLLRADR